MQINRLVILGLLCAATVLPAAFGQGKNSKGASEEPALAKVITMQTVPDGRYKANIKNGEEYHAVVIHIEADSAQYAETKSPVLKGMKGQFQHIGNGVFLISMANDRTRATQFWVFRPDGSAAIKEIPDRGENQIAVPIGKD